MLCKKHQYFVLYRGDDTDFPGNQELIVELNTERDLTGCSAHFSFQGFTQDFAEIPSDKKLRLVIPNSATGKFALGAADAKLWLTNGTKIRTVENRIHIVVTNRVDEAYDNDDPQAITVTISGGGGGATVVLDDTVTEKSPNGVKSSGIWSWVKSLLPHWLTSDYAEPATVESVANKRDKSDLAVYSVTRTENTDWTWTGENAEIVEALNNAHSKPYHANVGDREAWTDIDPFPFDPSRYSSYGIEDADLSATSLWYKLRDMDSYEVITVYASRPRYMDEALGPEKPNQQLAAVATDDAAKPADGSLMKYDAANDRFVKATPSEDYATETEVSQKADRATTLSGYGITDAAPLSMISATDTTFASAVRAVPTTDMPEDMPTDWGAYGTVGAALAALAAFVKWAKAKIVSVIGDDGKPTDQFATDLLGKQVAKAAIIYKANTATGLKDRAFNALSLDGTEYNLSTALSAVTPTVENQPRDLLIVATATASTTISFTAGTIKGDKPTIDGAGTWLITLTEYAANTWYCRQIKMEDAA